MKRFYRLVKLNRIVRSYRVKFFLVFLADLFGLRHMCLRLDPVNACNLRCSMCYYSDRDYAVKIRGRFDTGDINRICDLFFSKTLQLVIGCGSEPTLYKDYMGIVQKASEAKVPYIGLTTNGQLITDDDIERMIQYRLNELTISVHGVHKNTYETLMVNADYNKIHEVLASLTRIKNKYGVSHPDLRVNYTTNADNLEELTDFFSVYGQYDIKTLQLRPMVDVGHTAYSYTEMDETLLLRYLEIIELLKRTSHNQGVTLLSTTQDPNFQNYDKSTSYVLPAVLRTIHPNKVWMTDFDWRSENYREYCRRTNWRSVLLHTVFGQKEYFKKTNHYLTYNVDL